MPDFSFDEQEHVGLCEAVDRVLHKGALISGEVTISVADIELVKLGLQVVLASTEKLLSVLDPLEIVELSDEFGGKGKD
jgi:hypothetical protein